jgi:secondary thiamine-phosphate synthase enzyme
VRVACRHFNKNFTVATSAKAPTKSPTKSKRFCARAKLKTALLQFSRSTPVAALIVMENADPTARRDLEEFFDRLVPENADYFEHDSEGADDMPSHIRMVLTHSSETIPLRRGGCSLEPGREFSFSNIDAPPIGGKLFVTVMGEYGVIPSDSRGIPRSLLKA